MKTNELVELLQELAAADLAEGSEITNHPCYIAAVQIQEVKVDNSRLREAIKKVQDAAVHGLYGEAPETDVFGDALWDLYDAAKLNSQGEVMMSKPWSEQTTVERCQTAIRVHTKQSKFLCPTGLSHDLCKKNYSLWIQYENHQTTITMLERILDE